MARASILEYLDNFRRHAGEPAYAFRRGYRVQRWSYGDVLQNAYRFARALEAKGISKGDKVLIWGENCAEWVIAFFGSLIRGAIVVPIDKIAAPDFAARVAQQVAAKLGCRTRTSGIGSFARRVGRIASRSGQHRRNFTGRYCGDRVHLGHDGGAARSRSHSRQHSCQP